MRRREKILFAGSIALSGLVAFAAVGYAACKDVTVEARGVEDQNIELATASAGDALRTKIASQYGRQWSVGSRRYGSFHCDRRLGGRKPGWTCTAKTTVICAP